MSTYDEVDEGVLSQSSALLCAVGPRQGRIIVIWAEDLSKGSVSAQDYLVCGTSG